MDLTKRSVALAVQTPAHLESVGLLSNLTASDETGINYLLKSALDKVNRSRQYYESKVLYNTEVT